MIDTLSRDLSVRRTSDTNNIHVQTWSLECIVTTFLGHFEQQSGTSASWPRIYFDDDGVGDGVTREAFSLFWDAAVGRMFQTQGGDVTIPTLTPTYNAQLWEVVGRILAYTVAVLGQFPVTCVCQVLCLAIFGIEPDDEVLVRDFLSTLGERERTLLSPLFFDNHEQLQRFLDRRRNDILDVLREFNVPSLPPTRELRRLIVNVARYNFLEAPRTAITSMQAGFRSVADNTFFGVNDVMVSHWYAQQRRPIFAQITERLHMASDGEGARRMFDILMGFLRQKRENEGLLLSFLRYSTGSPNVRGERIRVEISRTTRVITHQICFSTIQLPIIEDNSESEQAFLAQLMTELTSTQTWTFNSA